MSPSTLASESLSVAILAVPALVRWLQGRRLVRQIDDPAFPELRLNANHRLTVVVGVSLVLGLLVSPRLASFKIFLAILALFAADHSSRRIIFNESRGLAGYLAHSMRFTVAMFGIWILLALNPALVTAAGSAGVTTAILLALTCLLWVHLGGHVFPALLRATPLDRPDLHPEFEKILNRSRCPRPAVLQADAPGGYWINAFAIPSHYRPAVLFTQDLLQALTPSEIAAIFAHEVAHLEWFTRRRLLQRDLAVLVLSGIIAAGVIWSGPDSSLTRVLTWIWPLVCFVPLIAAQSRQQALEHQADLRALELTGDAEALISGLTKIHHLMRLPRRLRGDLQAKQSHPSLAARLRAIRQAAGSTRDTHDSPPLPELIVHGTGTRTVGDAAVFGADHVHWLRRVPDGTASDTDSLLEAAGDRRSIRYEDLSDLRLDIRGNSGRHLVAIDRDGATLRLDLRPADVAAVKNRLQQVDGRLPGTQREVTAAMQGTTHRRWLGRIWGLLAALLGLLPPYSLPLAVAGALVVWRPARATIAAAAAIGIGLLFVGFPVQGFQLGPIELPFAAETLLGFILLFELVSRVRAKTEDPVSTARRTAIVLGLLAACYLAAGLWRLGSPLPWMQFHQWARFGYGLTLALLGLAAATLTLQPRSRRVLAVAPAMLAVMLMLGGTLWFRDHFGDDPLGRRIAPVIVEQADIERLEEWTTEGYVTAVRISPSGTLLATRQALTTHGFDIRRPDNDSAFIEAIDLVFLDDEHVAVLHDRDGGLTLEVLRCGDLREPLSEVRLPALTMPRLVIDPSGNTWEIAGTDVYQSVGMRLSGRFDSPDFLRRQWDVSDSVDSYLTAMAINAAPAALAVMGRIDFDGPAMLATYLVPFGGYAPLWEVSLVDEAGLRSLALTTMNVECLQSALGQVRFFCTTYDPEGVTRLWSVEEGAQRLEPVGTLPGIYHTAVPAAPGQLVFVGFDGDPLWFDGDAGVVRRLRTEEPLESGDGREPNAEALPRWFLNFSPDAFSYGARHQAADVRGRLLALASYRDGRSTVVLHRLPEWNAIADPSRQARLAE